MARKAVGRRRRRVPVDVEGRDYRSEKPSVESIARTAMHFGSSEVLICVALAIVTLAIYGQVMGHQFINLDDNLYIWENPTVQRGLTLSGTLWAFTTFHAANWHPVTWLAHMFDTQIFGLNAGGHLFVNAAIHTANTLLLFGFVRRITGARWRSALVAALFALHPMHVESVAWAAERKDTLSTLFGLLCLHSYAAYVANPSWKRYVFVAGWLALGLMAKPMLVTWPFVLLLLDFWPFRRLEWRLSDGIDRIQKAWRPLLREKLPLFGLSAVSMVLTYLAQSRAGAVHGLTETPLLWRLASVPISYARYFILSFWPHDLAIYYPISQSLAPLWQWSAALLFLVGATVFALRNTAKRPYLITGWLWFLGTLVPVIGLVRVGDQSIADRYTYIPSIGLFVALVFGLADLATHWRIGRVYLVALSILVIAALASLTAFQIHRWRDSVTLFEHALAVTSDNFVVQNDLGCALDEKGKHAEAISHFAEALRLRPDYLDALMNMGIALRKQGKAREAIGFYERALRTNPTNARIYWLLGLARTDVGKSREALHDLSKAVELGPDNSEIRMDLGLALTREGKLSEAAAQLDEAVRLEPDSAEMHNNLGLILLMAGEPEKSLQHFSAALRLDPSLAVAQDNLRRAQKEIDARKK